jgi:hypothetical protein
VWLGRLLPHITIEPTEERDEAYDVPAAALPQTA